MEQTPTIIISCTFCAVILVILYFSIHFVQKNKYFIFYGLSCVFFILHDLLYIIENSSPLEIESPLIIAHCILLNGITIFFYLGCLDYSKQKMIFWPIGMCIFGYVFALGTILFNVPCTIGFGPGVAALIVTGIKSGWLLLKNNATNLTTRKITFLLCSIWSFSQILYLLPEHITHASHWGQTIINVFFICLMTSLLVDFYSQNYRKLTQAKSTLFERKKKIDYWAQEVAHNVNNVLMAIEGNLEYLDKNSPSSEIAEQLKNRINYARLSAKVGREAIVRLTQKDPNHSLDLEKPTDVCELSEILETSAGIASLSLCSEKRHKINYEFDLSQSLWVYADQAQLMDVFINLIHNSLEAMETNGNISISARKRCDMAIVAISDSGKGMDQDTLKKIFTPFFSTKVGKGRGLGLSFCREILQFLGGEITVASKPSKGTLVTICLPITSSPYIKNQTKKNVLLVEDESLIALGMKTMLKKEKYKVTCANCKKTALRYLIKGEFDIIISDVNLPDGNGWEIAFWLEDRQKRENVDLTPVILTSGNFSLYPENQLPPPANLFKKITKPIERDAFLFLLDQLKA